MKKMISLIIGSVFLVIMSLSARAADPFSDITNHKYKESIEFLHDRGVVQGYEDQTFRPDAAINRAEML